MLHDARSLFINLKRERMETKHVEFQVVKGICDSNPCTFYVDSSIPILSICRYTSNINICQSTR